MERAWYLSLDTTYIPDDLVHDLGNLDGVGRRAGAAGADGVDALARVGDMALVVDAVEILAIPAGGERDDGADAADAESLWQRLRVRGSAVEVPVIARLGHAAVADLWRDLG